MKARHGRVFKNDVVSGGGANAYGRGEGAKARAFADFGVEKEVADRLECRRISGYRQGLNGVMGHDREGRISLGFCL